MILDYIIHGFSSELEKIADENHSSGSTKDKRSVINFIKKHPYPEDEDFHRFAEKKGKDAHDMEESAYGLLSDFFAKGKSKGKEVKATPQENKKGIKVEMEHTSNPDISDKIRADHHVEGPRFKKKYYKKLDVLEEGLKKGK